MRNRQEITIGTREFIVDVINSRIDLEIGLSNQNSIPRGYGLLFLYSRPWYYIFWMKGMKFPIDIIGISEDGRVAEIKKGLKPELNVPETMLKKYAFTRPIIAAVEVNEGDSFGINVGDQVFIGEEGYESAQQY